MIDSGRLAARSVTFGGLAVSLIANLLHSRLLTKSEPVDYVIMVGSALPPLFLLGAVEVVLNVRWKPGFWSWVVRILLIPIAGISFYISWLHMSELVASWGASDQEAFLYPIMIDVAMLLSAGAQILEDQTPEADRSEGSAGKGPAVLAEIEKAGPGAVLTIEEGKPARSALGQLPDPPAVKGPEPIESFGPGSEPAVRLAEVTERTLRTQRPDPQRTGDRTPVSDRRLAAPSGSSRVEQLLPIARPIVEAEPGIGWKPLAAKLREAGHSIGTQTARELRAALPGDEDGEEVSSDARSEDQVEARDLEEALRV